MSNQLRLGWMIDEFLDRADHLDDAQLTFAAKALTTIFVDSTPEVVRR